jgi:hypothetical protein
MYASGEMREAVRMAGPRRNPRARSMEPPGSKVATSVRAHRRVADFARHACVRIRPEASMDFAQAAVAASVEVWIGARASAAGGSRNGSLR